MSQKILKDSYFRLRNVSPEMYHAYQAPRYLLNILTEKSAKILDFGCGYGQMVLALKKLGYSNIEGADINSTAIEYLKSHGSIAHIVDSDLVFYSQNAAAYDFVILSHVLEHIQKEHIIEQLKRIKTLIKPGGALVVMVPNAQSNTGCYWAYEDFTHHTLFTAGSLYFVLRASGFSNISFIDIDCTAEITSAFKLILHRFLLWLISANP